MKKYYLLSLLLLLVITSVKAQLTGMSPSQAIHGQYLTTTITSNNLFIQTSSPSGNFYEAYLQQGAYIIPIFDFWSGGWWPTLFVQDGNTTTADISIPPTAPTGAYDLHVTLGDPFYPYYNQVFYTLPAAFTVLPPAGYITGTVYEDLNLNGVKDVGEPPLSGQTVVLTPGSISVNTDVSGNYSFPAANGTYTVTLQAPYLPYMFGTSPAALSVTVNNANAPNNNFGRRHVLSSITPNIGYRGMTKMHQIVSDYPIFVPGANINGNVVQVRVMSTPNLIPATTSINVIDSFTVWVTISIPPTAATASNIDIRILTYTPYYGYHYLKQKFNIQAPPAFVSGTMFFDQNQNKIMEATEPRIPGVKTQLYPDSSIAFSDNAGNYTLGSLGGMQVLSLGNNVPGLALFTDSVTYTFNATGLITGKNFGFTSTYPPFSINVKDVQLFARCNSQQYVYWKVKNLGNTTYNALAWIKRSPLMTFLSANYPVYSISNDTIYFSVSNIQPYTEVQINAKFLLPGAGNSLSFVAGANSLNSSGVVQQSHSLSRTYGVFCAWDPNDKTVTPPGILTEHYTLMSDTLTYLIRFQNTGNDTAFNVVVLDTLNSNLNYQTFELLGNSHSMKTEIEKSGAIAFTMNNIMLPDSNSNEAASHGYIQYRILAKTGLPDETIAKNTAHIFFDFNPAVVTNTTLNTLVYELPDVTPLPVELVEFSATPEKNKIRIRWKTLSEINNDYFTVEKSLDGHHYEQIGIVKGAGTTSNSTTYSLIDNEPVHGIQYYRLRQTDFNGDEELFEPVSVRWSKEATYFIYPNPANGQIFLSSEPGNEQSGTMMITDIQGKQVLVKEIFIGKDTYTTPLLNTVEFLEAGSYFINIVLEEQSFKQLLIVR